MHLKVPGLILILLQSNNNYTYLQTIVIVSRRIFYSLTYRKIWLIHMIVLKILIHEFPLIIHL